MPKIGPIMSKKTYFRQFCLNCLGDLVTLTGEQEIWSVSDRRLPDNPRDLA